MYTAAIRLVGRTVDAELACWATIDPETLVISTMVSGDNRIDPAYEPRLAESEYAILMKPHTFAALAGRGSPMAKLSDLPDNEAPAQHPAERGVAPARAGSRGAGAIPGRRCLLGSRRSGPRRWRLHRPRDRVFGCCRSGTGTRHQGGRACGSGRRRCRRPPAIAVIGADGALRSATAAARVAGGAGRNRTGTLPADDAGHGLRGQ